MRKVLALCFIFHLTAPVAGATLDEVTALYDAGDYAGAEKAGEALGTAEGLALAARAEIAIHGLDRERAARFKALGRAEDFARRAVNVDPRNVRAHLMLSAALGFRARMEHSISLAKKSRAEIEAAAALAPRDPEVAFARAIWHSETRIDGGGFGAKLLGADWDEAIRSFDFARKAWADRPSLLLTYAHALLRRDADDYRSKARELLQSALKRPAATAYERDRQAEAKAILAALDSGNEGKLDAALLATLPYKRK